MRNSFCQKKGMQRRAPTYRILVQRFSVADDIQAFARPSQSHVHATRVCEKPNAASFRPHRGYDDHVLLAPLVSAADEEGIQKGWLHANV